jgi:hypothetical protein
MMSEDDELEEAHTKSSKHRGQKRQQRCELLSLPLFSRFPRALMPSLLMANVGAMTQQNKQKEKNFTECMWNHRRA